MKIEEPFLTFWIEAQKHDSFWKKLIIVNNLEKSPSRDLPREVVSGYSFDTRKKYVIKLVWTTSPALNEVEKLAKFDHPNIIYFEKVTRLSSCWVLCMPFASQGDLVHLLEKTSRLSEIRARNIFVQIFSALKFMHSLGYVHRDVKLDNILISDSDHIWLTDFEFCENFKTERTKNQVGTFLYSSPELRLGLPAKPESDLWACGVSLCALVSGKFPFEVESLKTREEIQALRRWEEEMTFLSVNCKDLIRSLLNFNPRARISAGKAILHPWTLPTTFSDLKEKAGNLRKSA